MQVNTAFQEASELKETPTPQLHLLLSKDMNKVDDLIIEQLQSDIPLIPELAKHLIEAGGKRVRPLLTLASAKLCGYTGDAVYPLAAAVEFIHTATLLHDDVVDESELRRGLPSANQLWGNKPSVLVGDFLFSRSFEMMVSAGSMEVLDCLSSAARIIAEGEVDQLMTTRNLDTDIAGYNKVIGAKTAQLFAAAARVGPMLAGLSPEHKDALESYGRHIGFAFQLVDDVMDYFAASADIGKNIGDDFREGKMTLPLILAYGAANTEEHQFWNRTIAELKQNEGDFAQALGYMHRHGVYQASMTEAEDHIVQAKESLAIFPNSPVKDALIVLADYITTRSS